MPMLHDSVTFCPTCDHYVAVCETSRCAECDAPTCPTCTYSTRDRSLTVCSHRCQRIFNQTTTGPKEAA